MSTLFLTAVLCAPASQTPEWPLPWKEKVPYTYLWYLALAAQGDAGDGPSGRTTFVLTWNEDRTEIRSQGRLEFYRQGSALAYRFASVFDVRLRPRYYFSRAVGARPGSEPSGGVGTFASFGEKEITVRLGTAKGSPKETVPVPDRPFWIYGHQAIQHWAIFTSFLDTSAPRTVTLFMPDTLKFFDVAFTPDGTEETRGVTATRLAFRCGGYFSGKVWIGPDRRLLRYQQTLSEGTLDIWIEEPGKKKSN